jgi:hypothetical protein
MSVPTLMLHLELGHPNTGLLKITAALAERFHAGVIGIALCQLFSWRALMATAGGREWALGGVTRDLLPRAGRCALVSH